MTVHIQLSRNYVATVSDEDADLAGLTWSAHVNKHRSNRIYAVRHTGNGKQERLHRVIAARILGRELTNGEIVKFINGNVLDMRRENLRILPRGKSRIGSITHVKNKTGYRGVREYLGKYVAQISINGETVALGMYDTAEEAHEAYKAAAKTRDGEFSLY